MTDNTWVVPGAKGATINTAGWNSRIVMPEVTVTKVGKRDITVEWEGYSGPVERKFRLSDLHEQGRDKYHADTLVPIDSPRLAEIREFEARRGREVAARNACDMFTDIRNKENALAAIEALRIYVDGEVE